jgi:hypothetical protein
MTSQQDKAATWETYSLSNLTLQSLLGICTFHTFNTTKQVNKRKYLAQLQFTKIHAPTGAHTHTHAYIREHTWRRITYSIFEEPVIGSIFWGTNDSNLNFNTTLCFHQITIWRVLEIFQRYELAPSPFGRILSELAPSYSSRNKKFVKEEMWLN